MFLNFEKTFSTYVLVSSSILAPTDLEVLRIVNFLATQSQRHSYLPALHAILYV